MKNSKGNFLVLCYVRNTNVNLRSKWHDKDKYLLIWTLSKLIEHLGINFLEMVIF